MKYVVLKSSRSVFCVQLPEGFGNKLEIVCFENQTEFNDFIAENQTAVCQISLPQPIEEEEVEKSSSEFDGVFVRQNDYFKKILFSEIMWVEASRSYCYIYTIDKSRIILTYPMAELKKKLLSDLFIQIHRSFIVNKRFVNKFIGNMLYIDNQSFPISRRFRHKVLEHFLFLDNIKEKPDEKDNEPEM